MSFDPKKVGGGGNVDRWLSLIGPVTGENKSTAGSAVADPLFYNFAPSDKFSRGDSGNEYQKLVRGNSVAGAAEIAPPPFKGLSRFR